MIRVPVGVVCAFLCACNAVMPLEEKPDAGVDAAQQQDIGQGQDASEDALSQAEASIPDAPVDAPVPDQMVPDLAPDVWPWFDGGTVGCNKRWVGPEIVTVSTDNDNTPGTSPTIVAEADTKTDTFHIAFVEGKKVKVRAVTPLDTTQKMKLGTPQPLSKGTLEAVNPWLVNGPAGKLAAVWTDKNYQPPTYPCASYLMFAEFKADMSDKSLVNLSQGAPEFGYEWPTMVHHGGAYTLWSAVQYKGTACNTHLKAKHYSAASPAAGSVSSYSFGPYSWYPTIATTGNAVTPYVMLRLRASTGSTSPAGVTPELFSTATPGSWSKTIQHTGTAALNYRPALLGDGTAVWMAWTYQSSKPGQTGPTVKITRWPVDRTGTVSEADVPKLSRHPFLARRGDTLALVYSVLDPSTKTPTDIEIATVSHDAQNNAVAIGTGHTLASTPAAATGTGPDRPVVAAGNSGFGVAWQQEVNGTVEVRFRWVGCLPPSN